MGGIGAARVLGVRVLMQKTRCKSLQGVLRTAVTKLSYLRSRSLYVTKGQASYER